MTHPLKKSKLDTRSMQEVLRLTVDSIDLYQVFKHRFVGARPGPVKGDLLGLDTCERNCGRIWNFDT